MRPSVVSASKSGALSPMRRLMVTSPCRYMQNTTKRCTQRSNDTPKRRISSFHGGDAGVRALCILRSGSAGHADSADDLAALHNEHAAFGWNGSAQRKETEPVAARREHVLHRFGRPLEP